MSIGTNTKALNVRVIGPNNNNKKNNVKKFKTKEGNVDIHLSMTKGDDGHHTLTVGSKIDGKWVPLILKKTNRWWDRLSYVPKRSQQDKPVKNERKLKLSSQVNDDDNDEDWWDRLSRRPRRWVAHKEEPERPGSSHSQRQVCCGGEDDEAWWDRLSKLPWVQAQEQRQKFLARQRGEHEEARQTGEHEEARQTIQHEETRESSQQEDTRQISQHEEARWISQNEDTNQINQNEEAYQTSQNEEAHQISQNEETRQKSQNEEAYQNGEVPETSMPEYDIISNRSSVTFSLNESDDILSNEDDKDINNKTLNDLNYQISTSEYNDYSPREETSISSQSVENLSFDFQNTKDLLDTVLDLSAVSSDTAPDSDVDSDVEKEEEKGEEGEPSEASPTVLGSPPQGSEEDNSPTKESEDSSPNKGSKEDNSRAMESEDSSPTKESKDSSPHSVIDDTSPKDQSSSEEEGEGRARKKSSVRDRIVAASPRRNQLRSSQ